MHLSSPLPKKRARIEIIPLIDIMFFLLASFMMVSLSQTHMKGIKVNLPAKQAVRAESKCEGITSPSGLRPGQPTILIMCSRRMKR